MGAHKTRSGLAIALVFILGTLLTGGTVKESRSDFETRQRSYYGVSRDCVNIGPNEISGIAAGLAR